MATMLPEDDRGAVQTVIWDWLNGQKVAVSNTSAQSAAIGTEVVMLLCDTDCFIKAGSNPTAADSAGSFRLPANQVLIFGMEATTDKIAVIRGAADGSLYILPSVT